MVAVIAAVLFALALIIDLFGVSLGAVLSPTNLLTAGLLCVALHLAGIGTNRPSWRRPAWRARRR
jgi:ABC-type transport system involved in cytochrome c biogenesis permease component